MTNNDITRLLIIFIAALTAASCSSNCTKTAMSDENAGLGYPLRELTSLEGLADLPSETNVVRGILSPERYGRPITQTSPPDTDADRVVKTFIGGQHDGGILFQEKGKLYSVVLRRSGPTVYVNFLDDQTQCGERHDTGPVRDLVARLRLTPAQKKEIERHIRLHTRRQSRGGFFQIF